MNLFIDSISNPGALILFEHEGNHIHHLEMNIAFNESSKLVGYIDQLLQDTKTSLTDIENIIVVNGPGSFTGVRTTVLIANTFAFRSHIMLTPISYFDLFDQQYPIIKKSSKRDVFIQKKSGGDIEIVSNNECIEYIYKNKITKIYGDFDIFSNMPIVKEPGEKYSYLSDTLKFQDTVETISIVDYKKCIFSMKFQTNKQIEPLYIKKPNIS